jgi:predicted nucleic acid-binding protein
VILVDSNIPMYLVGAEHPNKAAARRILETAIAAGERLVTDAEVFQEILHRYTTIDRRDAIEPAFEVLLEVVDDVLDIGRADVLAAKRLVMTASGLSARDAIHVAVMQRHDIGSIATFDAAFDGIPGIIRLA